MKALVLCGVSAGLYLAAWTVSAQFGGMGGMPAPRQLNFSGAESNFFGGHTTFSATMEMSAKGGSEAGGPSKFAGKIFVDQGKSRFEMDLTQAAKGREMEEMKSMGMDKMVMISRPDKNLSYLVYPGLKGYTENKLAEAGSEAAAEGMKVETQELGKEQVDGHPCVKNKVIVTGKDGKKHEALVWNATDLKNFPVKMEQTAENETMIMAFKDVKFERPAAGLFEPPAEFKKHANIMGMMQEMMMQQMGEPEGRPSKRKR